MKALRRYSIYTLVMAMLVACKQPDDMAPSQAFLHLMDVPGMYIARGALALPDGSTVVGSVGFENPNNSSSYGQLPSLLTKLDTRGRQLWQLELPMIVHELWECHLLRSGHILALGFENIPFPERVGVAIISAEGEVLHTLLIPNQTISTSLQISRASLSALELSTGEIAIAMPTVTVANSFTRLRLIRLSQTLEIVESVVYEPNQPIPSSTGIAYPRLQEDPQGNLIILGAVAGMWNNIRPHFALTVRLLAPDYAPDYVQLFTPAEQEALPSGMALTPAGEAIWASAGLKNDGVEYIFNLRFQEGFMLGRTFTVWKTNGINDETQQKEYGGFPKLGFIQSVVACSDGGYLLAGTCNINENPNIPSAFRIMLVKLDADLEMEWMRLPSTDTPSFGAQAREVPGGYLVTASNLPDAESMVPYVFKTNYQGIIQ